MLNTAISLLLIFLMLLFSIDDYKKSVFIYVIGTFVSPVLRIGGIALSFDVIAFPILLGLFINESKMKITFDKIGVRSFVPYFVVYFVLTVVDSIIYGGNVSFVTLYAVARFIVSLHILKKVWGEEMVFFLDKVLTIVLALNVVCCIIQMLNLVSVEFFYNLYYKESITPLLSQIEIGYFNRAFGTTASPVILGGISALSYTFYLSLYIMEQYDIRRVVLKICGSIMCGFLALSKTAILTIPIMTIFVLVLNGFYNKKKGGKRIRNLFIIVGVGCVFLSAIVLWMKANGFAIEYYLEYLKHPIDALNTRYDNERGNLANAIEIIKSHYLIGVGHTSFNDVFIGDSVYVVLLYQTGVIGLIAYMLPYLWILYKSVVNKELLASSLVIVFFLISLGNALHLSYFLIPFVAVMFGIFSEKKSVEQESFSVEREV